MNGRLSLATLGALPPQVRRPAYDPATLGCGLVHLGVGAFHRAHQGVFTDDAVALSGSDMTARAWGVVGVSLRRPDAERALAPQDGLYTVETLGAAPAYRVIGAIRQVLTAPESPEAVLDALAARETRVITLTVTEKGYGLGAGERPDGGDPDTDHDRDGGLIPRTTLGWLAAGLARRRAAGGRPLTIISCDNLRRNGARLGHALVALADRSDPALARWIADEIATPDTMVDCITPASDPAHRARVRAALGMEDQGSVQREPFAQWVIQDRFADVHPPWERVGAELVADVGEHERLKLHVLNAAHSALAYLGLARGLDYVRQTIANPDILRFVDALVSDEIAAALPELEVAAYWRGVRARFANPALDHRLAQIAEDGSIKLAERVHPLLVANIRAGRPAGRLAGVIAAWLDYWRRGGGRDSQGEPLSRWATSGGDSAAALDQPALFAAPFRVEAAVRAAVLAADTQPHPGAPP